VISTAAANTNRKPLRPLHPSDRGSPARAALRRRIPDLLAVGAFSAVVNVLTLTGSFYMLQVYDRVLVSRSVASGC
jgi:ATP-binding cassette subfamily C protein PrsD